METLSWMSLPIFDESSQVTLSLFADFMAFYFTKTHTVDKEVSASGGLTLSPRPSARALPPDPVGGLLSPDSLLCPPNYGERLTPMPVSLCFLSPTVPEENLSGQLANLFNGRMSFLSPNQQCQQISKLWPKSWPGLILSSLCEIVKLCFVACHRPA